MTSFDTIRTRLRDMLHAYPFVSGFLATLLLSAPLVCCVLFFVVGTTFSTSSKARQDNVSDLSATSSIRGTLEVLSPTLSLTPTLVRQTSSPTPLAPAYPYPLPTRAVLPPMSPYPVAPPTHQQPTLTTYPYPIPARPTAIIPTGYPTPGRPTAIIPTSYPSPSLQAVQPTAPLESTSTPGSSDVLESSGIGLDRVFWEETQGIPEATEAGFSYKDGAYVVEFEEDVIWYLKRVWGDKDALPIEEARHFATRFIPDDSELVEAGALDGTLLVDWYHSEWLKKQFVSNEDIWGNSDPGDFTITYTVKNGRAVSFVITLGNTP